MLYLRPMPFISFLHKPFPSMRSTRKAVWSALAFGAFVGFFLYFFKPFGLGELERGLPLLALGYGAVTTFGMLFMQLVLPLFFPAFYSEDDWTVGREIVHTLGNVLLIAVGNLAFSVAMGFFHLSAITFLVFIGFTLGVGAFPVTVGVLLRQNAYQRRYLAQSELYNTQIDSQHADSHTESVDEDPVSASAKTANVKLHEEGSGKPFECPAAALLAIEAADNYVKLHLDTEAADVVEKPFRKTELLRLPLSAAEEALSSRPAFFRCHRSWLVNLDRLENVEGNARGYRLHLEGMKGSVPVSRSRIPDFQAAMEVLG